jgi:hypothetical protein
MLPYPFFFSEYLQLSESGKYQTYIYTVLCRLSENRTAVKGLLYTFPLRSKYSLKYLKKSVVVKSLTRLKEKEWNQLQRSCNRILYLVQRHNFYFPAVSNERRTNLLQKATISTLKFYVLTRWMIVIYLEDVIKFG